MQGQLLGLLTCSPTCYHCTMAAPLQQYWIRYCITKILQYVECVAVWLQHSTQDLEVWGSIPAVPVTCKSLGQALNPYHLCPHSSIGYQVEQKSVLCEWLQLQKMPEGDDTKSVNSNTWG